MFDKIDPDGQNLGALHRMALRFGDRNLQDNLAILYCFDMKMMHIAAQSSEMMIGQIKLAWWRDKLSADFESWPKGEPLLNIISEFTENGEGLIKACSQLVDMWEEYMIYAEQGDVEIDVMAAMRSKIYANFYKNCGHILPENIQISLLNWSKSLFASRFKAQDVHDTANKAYYPPRGPNSPSAYRNIAMLMEADFMEHKLSAESPMSILSKIGLYLRFLRKGYFGR
ncbi:hypothetical protein LPB140_07945 [Sphingorhabdus lutea]|uniref:Phytoene synthase n=1 Tax=Sphingorhabdus lutea TaxID=1913578 RepID=A0A1L3JC72_9SPHN|nr:hypothetical protein [Sphingorhabdus lutea]APG62731.1 hypothetical protein LPB140_07945 [Sphingorhabdus lutea]